MPRRAPRAPGTRPRPSPPASLALVLVLAAAPAAAQAEEGHRGPPVPEGSAGPARFVGPLYREFDAARALRDVAFCDQGYRAPGDPHYEAALERLASRLRALGFGRDERLTLRFLETPLQHPVWIPRSASLILRVEGRPPEVLSAFAHPSDRDRTMLPIHAPAADVEGRPVFGLSDVEPGTVLVIDARLTPSVLRRAQARGAVAALSSALFSFTTDPTGRERHHDAILFAKVTAGTTLPVAQISPRTHERILAATEAGPAFVALTAQVEQGEARLRTLVAEVVGERLPDEAVAISSHVQEPGAGDNASGICGLAEAAAATLRAVRAGRIPWPARTVAFVWGDEMRQTRTYLDATRRTVVAGISADMLGQSPEETGAILLLERGPDPGALAPLPPDEHTPWGAGTVLAEDLVPHGLHAVARAAVVDVGRQVGGWTTGEHPWEGGSDHDVYFDHDIPALLLWHFTDFTYHTSLDRMEMLDGEELRRSAVAAMATALAVADAGPADLERYLEINEAERRMRLGAAREAADPASAERWDSWCDGAEVWLRALCRER